MSQPPQPPSWGDPVPPYPPPPYAAYPPPPQPAPGMSNRSKFWIGVLLVLPVLGIASTLIGVVATLVGGTAGDVVGSVMGMGVLVSLIAGVAVERTRWFVAGMLAGGAVVTITAVIAVVVVVNSFLEIFS